MVLSYIISALYLPVNLYMWSLDFIAEHAILAWPFWAAGFFSITTYLVLLAVQNFYFDRFPVNLKTHYNAKWALVTGASSGIGKAIVERLVKQDINVVLVAFPDKLIETYFSELTSRFSHLEFRKVAVDLGKEGYMDAIMSSTADIQVTLLFNNAGFICAGPFVDTPLAKSMANMHCNATCCLPITHHFVGKMINAKARGFVAFTSSSAGFVPNPLSCLYASTKAFMTLFACSLAAEVRSAGVDVTVVHPSPMATNFFHNAGKLSTLKFFEKFAAGPSVIADVLFSSAGGRCVVRDQGVISIIFRLLLKGLDLNAFCELTARTAHTTGDFKAYSKEKAI